MFAGNHHKNINSIWNIEGDDGIPVEGFESIAKDGVQHFEHLFQEEKSLHLLEILKIVESFPTSISDLENEDLMLPVTLLEIQNVLSVRKNDKSPGLDGIPVEVYRVLFDVLGPDLLKVVDDSWKFGKVPTTFNSKVYCINP